MANQKDIEKELKDLGNMEVSSEATQALIKIPVLKARTSSRIGLVLIIFPFLFVMGAILKHYLGIDNNITGFVYNWVVEDAPDDDSNFFSWVIRFFLLGGPLILVALNLLAILHVQWLKDQKQLILTFNLKRWNILLIFIGAAILFVFFLYALIEG